MQNKQEANVRSTLSGRNHLLWGRAFQLLIQYKVVSPEHIDTGNMIQDEQITFRNYVHVTTINGKRIRETKRQQEGVCEREEGKGGKLCNYNIKNSIYKYLLFNNSSKNFFIFGLIISIYVLRLKVIQFLIISEKIVKKRGSSLSF